MALTTTHKQWMQDTELSAFQPRGLALKAVDEAILQYQRSGSEPNLWRVRSAFEDWKRFAGPAWQMNERNRKQAMTRLDRELVRSANVRAYQATHMTTAESLALAEVAEGAPPKKYSEDVFSQISR